jgi:hypothetical protein
MINNEFTADILDFYYSITMIRSTVIILNKLNPTDIKILVIISNSDKLFNKT